jgi:hypothetical protein
LLCVDKKDNPVKRIINTKGNIMGDICPFYYYCQVQQQLECCNLNVCDFLQCKFIEYESEDEYLKGDLDECENDDINNNLKKGLFLEFYPNNFEKHNDDDKIYWKSKYIIPERLNLTKTDYDNFVKNTFNKLNETHPDIYNNYTFNKIIYWKLIKFHNVPIYKNVNFINKIIPILKNTWDTVIYYKNNQHELNKLKDVIKRKKKYIKHNTEIIIHNEFLIKNKILFLDRNIPTKDIINKFNSSKKHAIFDNIDFIIPFEPAPHPDIIIISSKKEVDYSSNIIPEENDESDKTLKKKKNDN